MIGKRRARIVLFADPIAITSAYKTYGHWPTIMGFNSPTAYRWSSSRSMPNFLLFQLLLVLGAAQITDPRQWPGYGDMKSCAQNPIGGCDFCPDVRSTVGCPTWLCVCQHYAPAISALSSLASSSCSGVQQDIASATSILHGFCAQLVS